MPRRLYLLLVALPPRLIAAGCGDDDGRRRERRSQRRRTPAASGRRRGRAPAAERRRGRRECKQAVNAAPQLSAEAKDDLDEHCEDAGEGDEEAVREATKEVCVKIIEDTGAARPGPRDRRRVVRAGGRSHPARRRHGARP